jgi:2-polyprenyl-3-methyl-5-hydroxy-6-metoxy-1,4-benzoquinol methylase
MRNAQASAEAVSSDKVEDHKGLTKALSDYIDIDFSAMRPPGFLEKEATQIYTNVTNVDRAHGWIPNPNCPACGSNRRKVRLERFNRKVMQCLDCDLGYMDAFPADVEDVYSHTGYLETQEVNYLKNVDYRKKRFAMERLDIVRRHLKQPATSARLLDVGCGTGWFLEVAKDQGYMVTGVEIGKELAQYTSKKLGVTVHTVPLTELPATEVFDVITLFDVLEHVRDPGALLESLREHLNPGGIGLLFTPNLDSVGITILREFSSLIMPAEHLFYFTPTSLRRMIEETPLDILDFQTKGTDIPDLYSYFRDDAHVQPVADFLAERGSILQAVIDSAGCANHMRFIVSRQEP